MRPSLKPRLAEALLAMLAISGVSMSAPGSPDGASLVARTDIGITLRIMPLGDSITWGSLSSTGNGYRGPLATLLDGTKVDFIGTKRGGTMPDNDNQGHSGSFLAEIRDFALLSVAARPNVILLHAGTNDMDLNRDVSTAPARLGAIIDLLLEKCPDASIFVAKIIFSTDPNMQARTDRFNVAIDELAKRRQADGRHVMAVDMSSILTRNDLADKKHPNDSGYGKMAAAWYGAIVKAKNANWIKAPVPSEGVGVGVGPGGGAASGLSCGGANWIKQGPVADLIRVWLPQGQVSAGVKGATRDKVVFADIDGDGLDDYLVIFDTGAVSAWRNTGNIPNSGQSRTWQELGTIATGVGEPGAKVRFADMNGDGRADYLILYDGGAVKAWLNTGNVGSGIGRNFEEVGTIASGVGEPGGNVRFADIDGDGLTDYLVIYTNGAVKAWRNTGNLNKDKARKNFEELGEIAAGISGVPGSKVRLQDYDGDGLADYLVLFDGGAMSAYRNTGNLNQGSGLNFEAVGVVAGGVSGVSGNMIRLADLNGDGLLDYLSVSESGAVDAWLNTGRAKRGAGVHFADLNGDGRDDLLWVSKTGAVNAWLNAGGNPQVWTELGELMPGVQDATLEKIEFADLDGDRLDDYLLIYNGGAVRGWRNNGNLNTGEGSNFDALGVIATGVGASGDKIRFADVDGDGIADYLVVWDGGSVEAYIGTGNVLNDGRNFNKLGVIAAGVGVSGEKVRFADIDGDGLDDYIVSWDGGAVEAWLNNGNLEKQPERPSWVKVGVIAGGVQNQGRVVFGDLNGDGKADYLSVNSDTGAVNAYINQCASDGEPEDEDDGQILVPAEWCKNNRAGTSKAWENFKVDDYLRRWWDSHPGQTNLAVNFGSDWGLGQSFRCGIPTFCQAPLCNTLKPASQTTPAGWMVLESFQNLNHFITKLRDALTLTNDQYATLQVAIEQDFDPGTSSKDVPSDALEKFSLIFGVASNWLGPQGGLASSFVSLFAAGIKGLGKEIQAADISLSNIAEEAGFMHSFFGTNLHTLNDMNTNLTARGTYSTGADEVSIADIFQDGSWVNYKTIPSLNTDLAFPMVSQQEFSDWLFKLSLGNLVGYIWKKHGVWITSIPMTKEECESNAPGNGDPALKLCQDGKGYFLQLLDPDRDIVNDPRWTATLPTFWDKMAGKYGIHPHDALRSSVAAYNLGGFEFKAEGMLEAILTHRGTGNKDAFASFPGIFTLPICDIETTIWKGRDLAENMGWIDEPGFSYANDIGLGGLCACKTAIDKNGKLFPDFHHLRPTCGGP